MNRLKSSLIFVALFLIALSFTACSKKGNSPTPTPAIDTVKAATWPSNADVYFIGTVGSGSTPIVPTIWKNGIPTALPNPLGGHVDLTGIAVQNNDVYVVGTAGNTAVYWKNGVQAKVPTTATMSEAHAIAISGNDIYIVGEGDSMAKVWKNGVETTLSSLPSQCTSIFINGSDVFVAGAVYNPYQGAFLWKNGQPVHLDVNDSQLESFATAVYISGSDVYVGGWINNKGAALWKNGVSTVLYNTGLNIAAGVMDVTVKGSDVYAVGYANQKIVLWKNGATTMLPLNNSNGLTVKISVAFNGSDLYITSGQYSLSNTDPSIFWKNGEAYRFSDNTCIITGMIIVPH